MKGLRKIAFATLCLVAMTFLTLKGKLVSYDAARAIVLTVAIYMIANLVEHNDITAILKEISEIAKAFFLRGGTVKIEQPKEKK